MQENSSKRLPGHTQQSLKKQYFEKLPINQLQKHEASFNTYLCSKMKRKKLGRNIFESCWNKKIWKKVSDYANFSACSSVFILNHKTRLKTWYYFPWKQGILCFSNLPICIHIVLNYKVVKTKLRHCFELVTFLSHLFIFIYCAI